VTKTDFMVASNRPPGRGAPEGAAHRKMAAGLGHAPRALPQAAASAQAGPQRQLCSYEYGGGGGRKKKSLKRQPKFGRGIQRVLPSAWYLSACGTDRCDWGQAVGLFAGCHYHSMATLFVVML